jgi:hypothetical protein
MLTELFKRLRQEYPPDPCNHYIVMDKNNNLILGIWIDGESCNFYIDEDELSNIDQLLKDIKNLLVINKEKQLKLRTCDETQKD